MFKRILLTAVLLCTSSSLFAVTQVTLISRTNLQVGYGDTSMEINTALHPGINYLQMRYWQTPACPVAPQISLQAKYAGNYNWQNMSVDQNRVFRHGGFKLDAIKVLFRQYQYQTLNCDMELVGFE